MIYDRAIDRLGKRWLRASFIQLHKWIQMGINFSVSAIKDSFDLRLDLLLARDSVDCCSLLLSNRCLALSIGRKLIHVTLLL